MIKYFIIFFPFTILAQQTIPCLSFLNSNDCDQSGYCFWKQSSCQEHDCYYVKEVMACNPGEALSYKCIAVTKPFPSIQTPCKFIGSIRHRAFITQLADREAVFPTISKSGYTLYNLPFEASSIYELYTFNVLKASYTELLTIIELYESFYKYLVLDISHPYYLQRIIYEGLQNIRDNFDMSFNERQRVTKKLWNIKDILHLRIKLDPNYLPTSFYHITFQFIEFKHLSITINTIYTIVTISWTEYEENGLLEVTTVMPQIFGLDYLITDIIEVKPTKQGDNQIAKINYQITVKWLTSVPAYSSLLLWGVDFNSINPYIINKQISCNSATNECSFSGSNYGTYSISDPTIPFNCANRPNYTFCRLSVGCSWDFVTQLCS